MILHIDLELTDYTHGVHFTVVLSFWAFRESIFICFSLELFLLMFRLYSCLCALRSLWKVLRRLYTVLRIHPGLDISKGSKLALSCTISQVPTEILAATLTNNGNNNSNGNTKKKKKHYCLIRIILNIFFFFPTPPF